MTTPREATGKTSFSLVYATEVVAPVGSKRQNAREDHGQSMQIEI